MEMNTIASNVEEIEKKALSLSNQDKGKLIRNLILSLENEERDVNVEKKWIEESKRRILNYKEGKTKGRLFNDVIREVRESLR